MPVVEEPRWVRQGVGRPLFAVYHGPVASSRDVGVVLCKPFGEEMLCAHRALRHLANRLAADGFPTLRFDYDGTGDSSGGDADADRVTSWLDSIGAAVGALRERGVARIAMIGLRFGALLAAEYAKRDPVDALVLIAPPVGGRAYVREHRALQAMRMTNGNGAPTGPGKIGFLMSDETAERLAATSMAGDRCPASRVFVAARDDLDGREGKVVEQLSALGAQVTLSRTAGYSAMMRGDPVTSVVPEQVWGEIVGWLASGSGAADGVPRVAPEVTVARVRAAGSGTEVLEEMVNVDGMFGILSSPADGPRRMGPTILLPNVGANHHVGCNRIYVDLARRWSSLGFSVLRFDLVGIGDTPALDGRRENEVYSDSCASDCCRAMNWLAGKRGQSRFALGGICSGAYVSYYAALADPRVESTMLINPLTFHWREGDSLEVRMRATLRSTHFYKEAVKDVHTWIRAARGDINLVPIAKKMTSLVWGRIAQATNVWLGTDTDVATGFRTLCSRGTRVLLICGEDDGSRDVIAELLGPDAQRLRREPNFQFAIAAHTDHTFSPIDARNELMDRLTTHLVDSDRRSPSSPVSQRVSNALRALRR